MEIGDINTNVLYTVINRSKKKAISPNDNLRQFSENDSLRNERAKNFTQHSVEQIELSIPKEFPSFDFTFNEDPNTGKFFMQIIDKNTKKVIKQVPSQEYLDTIDKLRKKESLFIDRKL